MTAGCVVPQYLRQKVSVSIYDTNGKVDCMCKASESLGHIMAVAE